MPRTRIHASDTARSAASRAARAAAGGRQINIWLSLDALKALRDRMAATGLTARGVIEKLLMRHD